MRTRDHWLRLGAAGVTAILLIASSASAQISWLRPEIDRSITLQILKADFNGADNLTFATSVWYLSCRLPIATGACFIGELPFSHVGVKPVSYYYGSSSQGTSEDMIGNPYLGLELNQPGSSLVLRFGGRLPIAEKSKYGAALLASIASFDRAEAFFPDVLTMALSGGYRKTFPSGVTLNFMIGPAVLISNDTHADESYELWGDYYGELRLKAEPVILAAGFTGRMLLSSKYSEGMSLGDRMVNQIGFGATFDLDMWQPGLHLQVPLDDDLQEMLNLTYGINLTLKMR